MLLAVLVVILLVSTTATAYLFTAERDKSKEVEAGEGISQVAFVRQGVVVEMDQPEEVDTLTLYDDAGDQISQVSVGKEVTRVLADLAWVPYLKYRFDVKLKSGDVLSTPAYAPEKPVPYELFEISYADEFPIEEYHASVQAHSHVEAVLHFSPDGTRLGVGGLEGRISVVDINQEKELWVKRLDDLSIESVQFSDDGTKLLVGGHHIEYRFFCLDAANGDELWHKDVRSEVGETPEQSAPSTYLQTKGDRVWMGLSVSWTEIVEEESRSYMTEPRNTSRILHYRSKMYCYNLAGEQIWTFPVDGDPDYDDWGGGVMDRGLMSDSIMVDDAGDYLSVAFSSREGDTKYDDAQLVVFDAQTGEMLWNWSMPIIHEYAYRSHITNAWLSADGKWIAVGSMDGRAYLFDNAKNANNHIGQPEWERNLGTFMVINDIVTHTSDLCPYTDGENVIFHVARTQDTTSYYGNSMTMKIYGENLYVCYDMDGGLKWTFKLGETRAYAGSGRYAFGDGGGFIMFGSEHQEMSSLSQDSSTLYYSYTIHPTRTESYYTVLDLEHGSYDGYTHLAWRLKLDGSPGTQGDISEDGWYVAMSESPVDKDPTGSNPDYHGIYRVMIYV
jgi:outer membrane protein assembly factor BamB